MKSDTNGVLRTKLYVIKKIKGGNLKKEIEVRMKTGEAEMLLGR